MTTHTMETNTNMPEDINEGMVSAFAKRLQEVKKANIVYLQDGINPNPTPCITFNVEIKF